MMSNNVSCFYCHCYFIVTNNLLQFVELKGSVFKKFDKNNLFQVSCSDVRERFHLFVLLFIVVLQTMKEYSWKSERCWVLLPDCCMVLIAEIFVDWLKHAFITRFNELPLDVYRDYTTSLAYDMAQTRQKNAFSDHSDLVARRMGFIPLPLGVVMIRVLVHAVHIADFCSILICILLYLCLSSLRVLNNILILGLACHLITQHKQEKATILSSLNNNRADSPLPSSQSRNTFSRELSKDTVTNPLHLVTTSMSYSSINNLPQIDGGGGNNLVHYIPPPDSGLGSAAIFSNSTVDLKNVSLNEELLKDEGENIKIEGTEAEENVTKSDPNLNCEFTEELLDKVDIIENGMKKRAESEPSLNTLNNGEDETNK